MFWLLLSWRWRNLGQMPQLLSPESSVYLCLGEVLRPAFERCWSLTLTRWSLILWMVHPWGKHDAHHSVLQDPCWFCYLSHTAVWQGLHKVMHSNGLRNSLKWGKANYEGQCERKQKRHCLLCSLLLVVSCSGPRVLLDLLWGLHPSVETPSHLWPLLSCNHELNLRLRKIIKPSCTKRLESGSAVWRDWLGTPRAGPHKSWDLWEITAPPVRVQHLPLGEGAGRSHPNGWLLV